MTTLSRKDIVAVLFAVLCLGGGTLAAVSCGSSPTSGSGGGDHTTTLTGSKIGKYDGYDVHRFTTPDGTVCILMDNQYDNNIGLSCKPPTTPTTLFAP